MRPTTLSPVQRFALIAVLQVAAGIPLHSQTTVGGHMGVVVPWVPWAGETTTTVFDDSPLAAKGLLRHSNTATTQAHYIKDMPEEAVHAVAKIDALFAPLPKANVQ